MARKALLAKVATVLVSFSVGAILAPYMGAWFAEYLKPKPDIYFVKEECVVVPFPPLDCAFVRIVIRNRGQTDESSLTIQVRFSPPYVLANTARNYYETDVERIASGEARMISIQLENPDAEMGHGQVHIEASIIGTKVWDTHSFDYSW